MTLSPERVRFVAALAAVNVLLVAGGWLLLVGPQRHHAATAAAQAAQVRSEAAKLAAAASTSAHSKQPQIKTADLYRLSGALPATLDEPDLLLGLDQLARASGVRVVGLSPGAPTAGLGYTILPVALSLNGTYASLTTFLHRLRALVSIRHGRVVASGRLFAVNSVTLSPAPSAGKQLTATVSLQAFSFGAAPGVTPLPSSTGTDTTTTTTTGG